MNRFSLIACLMVALAVRCGTQASDPPVTCQGTETFRNAVQLSVNGGSRWANDSLTVCPYAYSGSTFDIAVRTLMTVTSGQTQGWSFSLKHDAPWTQYYGGSVTLMNVTTEGTDTATVQSGSPPDTNRTAIRTGFNGCTQGVMIDTEQIISLGPTANFVTSRACYRIDPPQFNGTYAITFRFTHDIGDPNVRSVIVQQGRSNTPCAKNFTLYVQVGGCNQQSYPACSLAGP